MAFLCPRSLSHLSPLLFILLIASGAAMAAVAPQSGDFQGCPEQGQGGNPALNRLKNRWMVDTQGQTKAQAVVVEITPRWRAANAGWR
jgi:hypothetical protein